MSAATAMQEKRLKPVLFKELAGGTLRRGGLFKAEGDCTGWKRMKLG